MTDLKDSAIAQLEQHLSVQQAKNQQIEQQVQSLSLATLPLGTPDLPCSLACDIYQVRDSHLCLFCIKYCQQALNQQRLDQDWFEKKKEFDTKSNALLQPFRCHCNADHIQDRAWMRNQVTQLFQDIFQQDQETIPLFNQLMSTTFQGQGVLQYSFQAETNLLQIWKNSVETGVFDWNDLNVQDVVLVIQFMDVMLPKASQSLEKDTWRLGILSPEHLFTVLDLKFIRAFINIKTTSQEFEQEEENIMDQLEPSINQIQAEVQIKNRLLNFVDVYYLQNLIRNFDKIDPLEIQSLSPMSRIKIDSINVSKFMEEKQGFPFCQMAQDALTYMIRQETIPEIIKEARVMPLAFVRYIAEYKIAQENEFQKIQHILFDKYAMFKNFEMKQKSMKGTVDDQTVRNLQTIREDYATFFVNQIFKYGDLDLKGRLVAVYNKGRIMKDPAKIRERVKYEKQFLPDDFSAKILDLMLGYILNQVKMQGTSLLTEKLYNIMDNAIFFFFNSQDTYSQNIYMLCYEDFKHYFDVQYIRQHPSLSITYDQIEDGMAQIGTKIKGIFSKFAQGRFQGKDNDDFIQQLEEVIKEFNQLVEQSGGYKGERESGQKEERESGEQKGDNEQYLDPAEQDLIKYMVRNALFSNRLVLDILQLLKIYDIHKDLNESDMDCIQDCLSIVKTYLIGSVENQAVFLQNYYYEVIQSLFEDSPVIMSEFYLAVFGSSQVLTENYNFLRLVLDQMQATIKNDEQYFKSKKKVVMTNLLRLTIAFIKDSSKSSSTGELPYCDIIIQKKIMFLEHYLKNPHNIDQVIRLAHRDKNSKGRELFLEIIQCIKHVIKKRITLEFYQFLNKFFPLKRMIALIQLCGNQLDIRRNLVDIYCQIHVNLKNLLYDDRQMFMADDQSFQEKRTIMDEYFNYTTQLDFVIDELLFAIEYYDQNDSTEMRVLAQKHMTNQVMVMIKNMFDLFASSPDDPALFGPEIGERVMRLSYILDTNILKIQGIMGKAFDNTNLTHESVKNRIDNKVKDKAAVFQFKMKVQEHIWQIQRTVQSLVLIRLEEGKVGYVGGIATSRHKRQYFKPKSREAKVTTTKIRSKRFSNSMKERQEYLEFLEQTQEDMVGDQNKPSLCDILYFSYRLMKYRLFSTKSSDNRFINIFNQSTADSLNYSYNFVYFINISFVDVEKLNKSSGEQSAAFIDENYIFGIVEALCHALFLATDNIQLGFKQLIENLSKTDEELMMHPIWQVMNQKFNYVTNKVLLDQSWKINCQRVLLLVKLHQLLCEQNNIEMKKFFQQIIMEEQGQTNYMSTKGENEDYYDAKTNNRINRLMNSVLTLCQQREWDIASHQKIQNLDLEYQNNPELLPIACYLFDLLAELCSGPCSKNQQSLAKFTYDSYIMLLERNVENTNSHFYDLKLAVGDFLMALTEGLSQKIIPIFTITFNAQLIWKLITNSVLQLFYSKYESGKYYPFKSSLDKEQLSFLKIYYSHNEEGFSQHPLIDLAVQFYILMRKLAEIDSKFEQFIQRMQVQLLDPDGERDSDILLFDFLHFVTSHIEIINLKNQVERYYFKTPPITYFLRKDQKMDFLENVDRSSINSKLSSLLRQCETFEFQMDYRYKQEATSATQLLTKKHYHVKFKYDHVTSPLWRPHINNFFRQVWQNLKVLIIWLVVSGNLWYDLIATILLSLIMNFIVLASFEVNYDSLQNWPISTVFSEPSNPAKEQLLLVMTIMVTYRAVMGLFWFCLLDLKIIYKQWEHTQQSLSSKSSSQDSQSGPEQMGVLAKVGKVITKAGQFMLFLFEDHNVPIFLLFNMLAVLLGHFYNVAFFALSLFSFISIFNSMFYVVKAIAVNASKLGYLLLFTCILFFSFSLISHVFFRSAFTDNQCNTLQLCYLNTLQVFFINNEGVGSEARQQSMRGGNLKNYYGFTVFQLVFFILINVMIINIIQAFIVDTFSSLRNQEDERENDIQKFCFICGRTRYDFQKAGVRFQDHQKHEHNIWNYVKFIIFMKNRTLKDCNGLEIQLQQKILSNDISFFPLNRSLSLGNQLSINDSLYMQLKIQKKLDKLQDYLSTVQEKTAQLK